MQNDLEELERVLAAGTPGPWQAYEHIVYTGRSGGFSLRDCPKPYDDAALIVAAVNALPSLIEEVKRLREGWQPIKTAPKDGSNVLAWGCLHDDGGPYYDDGRSFMGETPHEMVAYFSPEHKIWRDRSHGGSYAGLTHWRPLPASPARASLSSMGGE